MWIDILDENNEVTGKATKAELYQQKLKHRIVHVLLVKERKLFIQQRSEKVSYLPGFYCTFAGGHVESGETPFSRCKT